jgi:acetyltransferase-like isoleucine patch superfamily enzyme
MAELPSSSFLEDAARLAPSLVRSIASNPDDSNWAYLRAQIHALQVAAHLQPLEAYGALELETTALDPRQSTTTRQAAGRVDLKQVTLVGKSSGTLWVGANAKFHKTLITAEHGPFDIVIGPNTEITDCVIQCLSPNCSVIIGSGTTIGGANLLLQETGTYILIGDDGMWSNGVAARTSDSHGVYDCETGDRINHGKPIIIHRHVWVGRHASMNKGTEIGPDAVIGQHAMTGTTMRGGILYFGNPAMPARKNITWDRTASETLAETLVINPHRSRQVKHINGCAAIDALGEQSLKGLPELHAVSRVLAASFPAATAAESGVLCAEAHRLREWALDGDRLKHVARPTVKA